MLTANALVDLDELKARHSLGDIVEAAGVILKGKGRVRQGYCPFHEEREGSFTVYADTERFHCFGCGVTGDVLDFVQRTEGLTLPEAIRRLGDGWAASPAVCTQSSGPARPRRTFASLSLQRDTALLTAALRFYTGQLRHRPHALGYLASRGISPDTAAGLALGYAPGCGLRESLESCGFAADRLRDCGLFLEGSAERFAGMVVVPEVVRGRVQWFTGRAVDQGWSPRFQALPGSKPILGLGRLGYTPPADRGRGQAWVVLTEGVFDWLTLAGWGLPACASLGTQGMERVADSLRMCPNVFLALDSDDPGRAATAQLEALLGCRAAIVTLPEGAGDVADLATMPRGRPLFLGSLQDAARNARQTAYR